MMRVRYILVALALLLLAGGAVVGARPAAAAEQCFPETGKCVRGVFLQYWEEHGGLAQQGYPLTDEFDEVNPTDGKTYRVQYFERARFEWHPENAGTEYEVLLGLAGREQFLEKYPEGRPASAPTGAPDEVCFAETQRCVRGVFIDYWQRGGGLAQQGLPISDEFEEVNPTNGQTYRVQYFERARFEHHPENAATQYEVLLGLLGREQLVASYPKGTPDGTPALTPAPGATPGASPYPGGQPASTPTTNPYPGTQPSATPTTNPYPGGGSGNNGGATTTVTTTATTTSAVTRTTTTTTFTTGSDFSR